VSDWELSWLRAKYPDWNLSRSDGGLLAARHPETGQVIRDASASVIDFRLRKMRDDAEVTAARPPGPWLR
jgi:hypothetical protein